MCKILYFVSEDWFFVSHFMSTAQTARGEGLEVIVATNLGLQRDRIASEGFRLVPFNVMRSSLGPVEFLRNLIDAISVIRRERPDIVHCISLRLAVAGGIAARFCGVERVVLAPTGLGYLWSGSGLHLAFLRVIVRWILGWWLKSSKSHYLFENEEDLREFGFHAADPTVTIVRGAGVDPAQFPSTPEPPAPPVKIAVVCRMIREKGIVDAVEAARRARALGAQVELHLIGAADRSARNPIPESVLRQWSLEPGIHWHEHVHDVASVWKEHHIAMLLSHREGVPRTLIEAAASRRAIVTTDAVGCREIVRDGEEGLVVPPGDTEAAAQAVVRLAGNAELRARLASGAHARFRQQFTSEAVQKEIRSVYRSMMA
jgi:glycosyltransferase involved in cell wall biosynthesis